MSADEIKSLRTSMKLSQRAFAERLGIRQATVSRLETGELSASGPVTKVLEQLKREASQVPETAQ